MENLSITRRVFANIIDIIIACVFFFILIFLFGFIFGPIVTDAGYYMGTINIPYKEVMNNYYANKDLYVSGEIWFLSISILAISISQLIGELLFSATCGIRLLGGVCINSNSNKITSSDSVKKFVARVLYLVSVYILLANFVGVRPSLAVIIIFIIAFVMLMKKQKNVIENITDTRTVRRGNSKTTGF